MSEGISRRRVLHVAALTSIALPVVALPGTAQASASEVPDSALVGIVGRTSADGMMVRTSDREVAVSAAPGARLYSGAFGQVDSTSRFVEQDRVAVEGSPQGDRFLATAIGSIFTTLNVEITSVSSDGSSAESAIGTISLTGGRLPFTPPGLPSRRGAVKAGSVLQGVGWTHPATGETYLLISAS